jgi:hypothetical protein
MSSLVITMQQAKEPFRPIIVPDLPETPCLIIVAREQHNAKIINYNMIKAVYDKIIAG